MSKPTPPPMPTATCPVCKWATCSVLKDGTLCTHGPGPKGEFICPGSGDKGMVDAAAHIKV